MSDYLKDRRIVDPVLINIARGYKNAAFIGKRIFPVVLTDKEDVRIPTLGKTAFVEYDTERAIGTDSNVLVREKTGTLDLMLGEHDLVVPVDYREQAESMFSKEGEAIHCATNGVSLHRELIAARLAQDEKVYRTGHTKRLTTNDHWTGGKGDSIGVAETGVGAARMTTGLHPNLMTMGIGVMALLKFHSAIQAAIGANRRKRITTGILQDFFQVEEIVTGAPVSLPSMKAAMGKNDVPTDIWGDSLMLYYAGEPQSGADSVDGNEPPFGYILCRKGTPVADKYDGAGGKVKYCRHTDIHKVAVVGGDAGYFITGTSRQGGVMGAARRAVLIIAITAGAALAQQRFVGANNVPYKAGAAALRVAEVDTVTGDSTPVGVLGIIAVEAKATVSRGMAVQSDAQARAVPQSDDGKFCGIVLGEAGDEDDVIRILHGVRHALHPGGSTYAGAGADAY